MKTNDVYGIGNALVDFLIEVDDNKLKELNLNKGQFHMIDETHATNIISHLKQIGNIKLVSGGSSANTLAGIAQLGGKVIFCGAIGDDEHGNSYKCHMEKDNVICKIGKTDKVTGHAITLITPDAQRTFAVHLGASTLIKKDHIIEEDIKNSKVIHLEGYQLEDEELRKTIIHAMDTAKKHNTLISIDLSDPGVIERNLKDIKELVKTYANIVFVNEEEAKIFTGTDNKQDALEKISLFCDIVIVKIGEKGSLIKNNNNIIKIEPYLTKAVDTTGAGDSYAAGFLYGLTHKFPLEKCGKIGSYFASKVVEQIGARLETPINIDHIQ